MTNPATVTDLTSRSLRPLTTIEQSVGPQLLNDAWAIIITQVPSAEERAFDPAFNTLAIQVECAMVLRVMNNPDGKLEESIDDYSMRLDASVSTGALYLSDGEKGLLSAWDGQSDGAFTIRPTSAGPFAANPRAYEVPWGSW